jgi:hypothetical protein
MASRGIPIGIAVIGVLSFLGGLLWLFIGVTAVLAEGTELVPLAIGAISVLIGLAFLLFGLGCLKGWGWVWTLGAVVSIVGIALTVIGWYQDDFSTDAVISNAFAILVQLFILIYLMTYNVKNWFGKA